MNSGKSGIKKSALAGMAFALAMISSQAMADRDRDYRDHVPYGESSEHTWRGHESDWRDDGQRRYRPPEARWDDRRNGNWREHSDHESDSRWRERDHEPRYRDEPRINSTQVTSHVDQIEDLSERVKNTLRKGNNIKKSGLGRLDGLLSAFDQQANQLRSTWKSQQSSSAIRPIVNDLMSQSRQINSEMGRRSVDQNTRSYWNSLQSELRSLSQSVD